MSRGDNISSMSTVMVGKRSVPRFDIHDEPLELLHRYMKSVNELVPEAGVNVNNESGGGNVEHYLKLTCGTSASPPQEGAGCRSAGTACQHQNLAGLCLQAHRRVAPPVLCFLKSPEYNLPFDGETKGAGFDSFSTSSMLTTPCTCTICSLEEANPCLGGSRLSQTPHIKHDALLGNLSSRPSRGWVACIRGG